MRRVAVGVRQLHHALQNRTTEHVADDFGDTPTTENRKWGHALAGLAGQILVSEGLERRNHLGSERLGLLDHRPHFGIELFELELL